MYSRTLWILAIASISAGCAHWQRESGTPAAILEDHPDRILVTRTDSSQMVIVEPTLRDSVIVGLRGSIRGKTYRNDTLFVPLADVEAVATWYGGFEPLVYVGFVALPLVILFAGLKSAGT